MELTIKDKDGNRLTVLYSEQHHKIISPFSWSFNGRGYAVAYNPATQRPISMHRLILGLSYGDKMICDHVNGNRLDNRIENLRLCTMKGNCRNRKSHPGSTSKFKGVTKLKWGRFQAVICADYKHHYLGVFATEEEAARAYDIAAKNLHGEFARLNFELS
jgi:hypothetical protein